MRMAASIQANSTISFEAIAKKFCLEAQLAIMIDRAKMTTAVIRVVSKRWFVKRSFLKKATFRVRKATSATARTAEMNM